MCVCVCVWSTTLFKGNGIELCDVNLFSRTEDIKEIINKVFYFYAFHKHANNNAESILI